MGAFSVPRVAGGAIFYSKRILNLKLIVYITQNNRFESTNNLYCSVSIQIAKNGVLHLVCTILVLVCIQPVLYLDLPLGLAI